MAYINLRNVSVNIPVFDARTRGLKQEVFKNFHGTIVRSGNMKKHMEVSALKNISIEINNGDRIGIIGRNGAGKTTLLRLLAGIYPATSGDIDRFGLTFALTDFALGMDPEATGYDNILIRAVMLGLSIKQAVALVPEIEDFTELGDYLTMPVRTYSSGMLLRLAFSVSTAVQPDILILDEVFGVGDSKFVAKAKERITNLIDKSHILIMASHDEALLKNFCNKILWLENGYLHKYGDLANILEEYNSR